MVDAGIGRVQIEARLDVLDDQVFGVDLTGANIAEGRAVLPLAVLMRVGIIPPDRPMLRDGNAGRRRGAWERYVRVGRRDVVVKRWQIRLGRMHGDLVGAGDHVVGRRPI